MGDDQHWRVRHFFHNFTFLTKKHVLDASKHILLSKIHRQNHFSIQKNWKTASPSMTSSWRTPARTDPGPTWRRQTVDSKIKISTKSWRFGTFLRQNRIQNLSKRHVFKFCWNFIFCSERHRCRLRPRVHLRDWPHHVVLFFFKLIKIIWRKFMFFHSKTPKCSRFRPSFTKCSSKFKQSLLQVLHHFGRREPWPLPCSALFGRGIVH